MKLEMVKPGMLVPGSCCDVAGELQMVKPQMVKPQMVKPQMVKPQMMKLEM